MSRSFEVGVQIRPNHVSWPEMRQAWIDAEALGADSIWTFDHFFPIDGDPDGSSFECWTTLAAMSQVTTRAAIGTLVCCYGYRNPDLLADMARTVDHAAGGRLVLGLGAGWLERDYYEYGFAMPKDAARLRELEVAISRLRYRLRRLSPPPLGPMPLLIGGLGEKMTLAITARHADLWNGWGSPDEVRRLNAKLDWHCERVGRDPTEIVRTVALFDAAGHDAYDDYAAAGAEHLILVRSGPDYRINELSDLIGWRNARNTARDAAATEPEVGTLTEMGKT